MTAAHRSWLPWALAAGAFVAIKLWIFVAMPPIGDEAYYWLWGQHPALSYFDHPPLHAWLLGLVSQLFGWNLYALRALTWVTFGATLWIFWDWSKRLAPEAPSLYFSRTTAIYLASPLFLAMGSIAFHDHLLIALCLASAHFMLLFAERFTRDGTGFRWLYLAALLLGLATLTKYNAVFLGLAFLAFLLFQPGMRKSLATPHPWLAALLSVAVQAPVFWWNFAEGFASYRFHLAERWVDPQQATPAQLPVFILVTIIVLSPVVVWGTIRLIRHRPGVGFESTAKHLAMWLLGISSAAMVGLAFFVTVFFYWNIVGFLVVMPLLAIVLRAAWLQWAHIAYGLVFGIALLVNQTVVPLPALFGQFHWVTSSIYGWDEVATRVRALQNEHPDAFIAATTYGTASQLAFALKDANVVALSPRHDQFDFWFDPEAHVGQPAIIVADPFYVIGEVGDVFDGLQLVEQLAITRAGTAIFQPQIYFARAYRPPLPPAE
ncbi:MAG TPA: glycosyltransferase family 39 protein [Devosia sp.]